MMRYLRWILLIVVNSLVAAQETVDWSSVVDKVSPAIVTIISWNEGRIEQGSGFLISSDGKIVTKLNFVADITPKAIVARRHDGSPLVITGILAADGKNELVILKAKGENLPFVALGDSDEVKVGGPICVISSPMLLEGRVMTGIVSDIIRRLDLVRGMTIISVERALQITVPISEDSSGSPVLNHKGEVIGIANFRFSQGNFNLAVPVNALKKLLKQIARRPKPLTELVPSNVREEFERTLKEALQKARGIEDASERSRAFYAIGVAMAKLGLFDQIFQIAQSFEDAELPLIELIAGMANAGVRDQSLWNQAFQAAQEIKNAYRRSETLFEIAIGMAGVNLFDQALQVAQRIENAYKRSEAIFFIAVAMASASLDAGDQILWNQSLQVAQKIEDAFKRSEALWRIATMAAELGEEQKAVSIFNQALKAAQSAESPFCTLALHDIAFAIAVTGIKDQTLWNQVLRAAREIKNAWDRPIALSYIAAVMARFGEKQKAVRFLNHSLQITRGLKYTRECLWALRDVAFTMVQTGTRDQILWNQVLQAAECSETLSLIVKAMAEAGVKDQTLWNQTLQVAQKLKREDERSEALSNIVKAMAEAGVKDRILWNQALQIARGIKKAYNRSELLSEIAKAKAKLGEEQEAVSTFYQSLQAAQRDRENFWCLSALFNIVKVMTEASIKDQTLWNQVLQAAQKFEEDEHLKAIFDIVEAMAKAGVKDQAPWNQALQIARGVKKAYSRSMLLSEIAKAKAKLGEEQEAVSTFYQSLQAAQEVEDTSWRSSALFNIVKAMAEAGVKDQTPWTQALQMAQGIENASERLWVLSNITETMATVGLFDQALQVAQRIEDASKRSKALSGIAVDMAEVGLFDQALQVAQRIEDASKRSEALSGVAVEMAEAGLFDQALQLVQRIEDDYKFSWVLDDITKMMVRADVKNQAFWDHALQVTQGIKNASRRSWALSYISEAMAEIGLFDRAFEAAKSIEEPITRFRVFTTIVTKMWEAGVIEE